MLGFFWKFAMINWWVWFQPTFRGSFVLTKVSLHGPRSCPLHRGLSAFRGPLLRGCLSITKINRRRQVYPLYGGCPLFRESIIRGFTLYVYLMMMFHDHVSVRGLHSMEHGNCEHIYVFILVTTFTTMRIIYDMCT